LEYAARSTAERKSWRATDAGNPRTRPRTARGKAKSKTTDSIRRRPNGETLPPGTGSSRTVLDLKHTSWTKVSGLGPEGILLEPITAMLPRGKATYKYIDLRRRHGNRAPMSRDPPGRRPAPISPLPCVSPCRGSGTFRIPILFRGLRRFVYSVLSGAGRRRSWSR